MLVKYIFETLPPINIQKEILKTITNDFSVGPDGFSVPIVKGIDGWTTVVVINKKENETR